MVMAQGYSREQVESILEDFESSELIDESTRALLRFSEKVTREAHNIKAGDVQALRDLGLTDEEILEATFVITWFNMFDRLADALGVPVENLREAVERKQKPR